MAPPPTPPPLPGADAAPQAPPASADPGVCVSCYAAAPSVRAQPCGHANYCGSCFARTYAYEWTRGVCPLCRGVITSAVSATSGDVIDLSAAAATPLAHTSWALDNDAAINTADGWDDIDEDALSEEMNAATDAFLRVEEREEAAFAQGMQSAYASHTLQPSCCTQCTAFARAHEAPRLAHLYALTHNVWREAREIGPRDAFHRYRLAAACQILETLRLTREHGRIVVGSLRLVQVHGRTVVESLPTGREYEMLPYMREHAVVVLEIEAQAAYIHHHVCEGVGCIRGDAYVIEQLLMAGAETTERAEMRVFANQRVRYLADAAQRAHRFHNALWTPNMRGLRTDALDNLRSALETMKRFVGPWIAYASFHMPSHARAEVMGSLRSVMAYELWVLSDWEGPTRSCARPTEVVKVFNDAGVPTRPLPYLSVSLILDVREYLFRGEPIGINHAEVAMMEWTSGTTRWDEERWTSRAKQNRIKAVMLNEMGTLRREIQGDDSLISTDLEYAQYVEYLLPLFPGLILGSGSNDRSNNSGLAIPTGAFSRALVTHDDFGISRDDGSVPAGALSKFMEMTMAQPATVDLASNVYGYDDPVIVAVANAACALGHAWLAVDCNGAETASMMMLRQSLDADMRAHILLYLSARYEGRDTAGHERALLAQVAGSMRYVAEKLLVRARTCTDAAREALASEHDAELEKMRALQEDVRVVDEAVQTALDVTIDRGMAQLQQRRVVPAEMFLGWSPDEAAVNGVSSPRIPSMYRPLPPFPLEEVRVGASRFDALVQPLQAEASPYYPWLWGGFADSFDMAGGGKYFIIDDDDNVVLDFYTTVTLPPVIEQVERVNTRALVAVEESRRRSRSGRRERPPQRRRVDRARRGANRGSTIQRAGSRGWHRK